MLELWLCPSRKQNTARVMQALCEKTAQRILVVPEQFSHEAERMLCRAGGDTISRFAEVLSFSRLASRVFSIEGGSACEETDAGGRLLLMALAVEQVRPRLKLFGASTSRPEFLLQLLDTLEEFRAYCLRPELLRAASEKLSGALAVKTEEFALLMESYDAACANAGQDPSSRLTRLAAALETGTFAAGRQLYLDGFTDLNGVELDLTDAEKKATYQEIKDYVLEHSGLKVSSLYIAQVKQKCGIIERENYNKPKSEDAKQPQCPPDKEKAIKEALTHFGMI